MTSHLLPPFTLGHEVFQLVGQVDVFVAELLVSCAVQLDLALDLSQHALEVGGDLRPLLLILLAALKSLLLEGAGGGSKWMNG